MVEHQDKSITQNLYFEIYPMW